MLKPSIMVLRLPEGEWHQIPHFDEIWPHIKEPKIQDPPSSGKYPPSKYGLSRCYLCTSSIGERIQWLSGWWFEPTPLKNHGGRQLGYGITPFFYGKSFKIQWFQKPPTKLSIDYQLILALITDDNE